jgi:hypothetical protein
VDEYQIKESKKVHAFSSRNCHWCWNRLPVFWGIFWVRKKEKNLWPVRGKPCKNTKMTLGGEGGGGSGNDNPRQNYVLRIFWEKKMKNKREAFVFPKDLKSPRSNNGRSSLLPHERLLTVTHSQRQSDTNTPSEAVQKNVAEFWILTFSAEPVQWTAMRSASTCENLKQCSLSCVSHFRSSGTRLEIDSWEVRCHDSPFASSRCSVDAQHPFTTRNVLSASVPRTSITGKPK